MPKILLVEDNEMNRDMLSRRLERRGYEVVIAVDGQQGVDLALSTHPDLILMDMSLPVIDGWEATRQIKSKDGVKATPIIALTAHAMSGDREKALEAGCDDYDTKPIELPRLLGKIEALLGARRQAAGMTGRGRAAGPRARRAVRAPPARAAHPRQRHPRLQRDAARGRGPRERPARPRADPDRRPHPALPDQRDPGPRARRRRLRRRTWRRRAPASATTCARP